MVVVPVDVLSACGFIKKTETRLKYRTLAVIKGHAARLIGFEPPELKV
jgi:hypothetical protein